jgi:hypothetical protein
MKWLVFLSLFSAVSVQNRVTNSVRPSWTDTITVRYCDVRFNNDSSRFAIPIIPGAEFYFTDSEKNSAVDLDSTFLHKLPF